MSYFIRSVSFESVTSPTRTLPIAHFRHPGDFLLCPGVIVPVTESKDHLALKEISDSLQQEADTEETLRPSPLKNSEPKILGATI